MARNAAEPEQADLEAARWFFEQTDDAFVVLEDGFIRRVNPGWTAITGWTAEESVGRSYTEFMHPEDLGDNPRIREELEARGSTANESRLLSRSNGWLWMRASGKRAQHGRTLVALHDVTAERRRRTESEHARAVAQLLADVAGIRIFRYDAVQDLTELNPIAASLTGERQVFSRDQWRDSVHPDDLEAVERLWVEARKSGRPGAIEYRVSHKGQWRRVRATWQGLAKRHTGGWDVLAITQDITELADARDSALAAAEAKAQFLANISHEIRTPMNGVLGVLHILRSRGPAPDEGGMIEEALACGATLSQLLDDIVDFSKLQAGEVEFTPAPVELASALEAVAGMVRAEAESRGLYLVSETPPDAGWVRVDPVRLRQMLFNLLGNAVKFTQRGGVHMRLTTRGQGRRRRLRVEIEDTGIGIPASAQATLFERFQQGDGSTTRRFGGAGLGLAVTKALAEQMGGKIGFKSREGCGSTFWFDIPAPACAPVTTAAEAGERWLQGLKVLVVEDNPTNRLVATRMLGALGAEVHTAVDGEDGVRRAAACAYDLIFMDIQMPVMDGVEATRRIRALPGPAAQTPIVATTANVMAHQVEAYRRVGMDGHLAKPISPAALLGEIVRLSGDAAAA